MEETTKATRYRLVVPEGHYTADTLIGLLWAICKHRLWHLCRGDGWVD